MNWREYQPHVINQFPPMESWEFEKLKKSIAKGFDANEPIWLYKGEDDLVHGIIDGVNRHNACLETGTIPVFKEFYGSYEDAKNKIRQTNIRRNLTASQIAAVELDMDAIVTKLIDQAEKNSLSNLRRGNESPDTAPVRSRGSVAGQIAEEAGIGTRTVEQAMKVKLMLPELYKRMKNGEVSAKAAEAKASYAQKVAKYDPDLYDQAVRPGLLDAEDAFNQIEATIAKQDLRYEMQSRAKNILKKAIQDAINEDKDMLYDAILDQVTEGKDMTTFKLKLNII